MEFISVVHCHFFGSYIWISLITVTYRQPCVAVCKSNCRWRHRTLTSCKFLELYPLSSNVYCFGKNIGRSGSWQSDKNYRRVRDVGCQSNQISHFWNCEEILLPSISGYTRVYRGYNAAKKRRKSGVVSFFKFYEKSLTAKCLSPKFLDVTSFNFSLSLNR